MVLSGGHGGTKLGSLHPGHGKRRESSCCHVVLSNVIKCYQML